MTSEPFVSVEMALDKPRWIKLHVFWSCNNCKIDGKNSNLAVADSSHSIGSPSSFDYTLIPQQSYNFNTYHLTSLTDVFSSKKYFDVIFYTNDSKKVFGHRCILYKFSDIFTALFDQSANLPVDIEVDFSEAIVTQALQFCYGKTDDFQNIENEILKFAEKYGIKGLKVDF